jgi:PBP1b-binding outer membrane lipoprotein LpoB
MNRFLPLILLILLALFAAGCRAGEDTDAGSDSAMEMDETAVDNHSQETVRIPTKTVQRSASQRPPPAAISPGANK